MSSGRDKLVAKLLSDNKELLRELTQDKGMVTPSGGHITGF